MARDGKAKTVARGERKKAGPPKKSQTQKELVRRGRSRRTRGSLDDNINIRSCDTLDIKYWQPAQYNKIKKGGNL